MPTTFPMALADFWDRLPIASYSLGIAERKEINATGAGEVLDADIGASLWEGEVKLDIRTPDEAAEVDVLLDLMSRSGTSFLMHDLHRPAPKSDPMGSILGASVPTLTTVGVDLRTLRLTGLPNGYILQRGDFLSFSYDSGRRAMHRLVSPSVTAPPTGETVDIEVQPALRPAGATGMAVVLVQPTFAAKIVPGTRTRGARSAFLASASGFRFLQTLGRL